MIILKIIGFCAFVFANVLLFEVIRKLLRSITDRYKYGDVVLIILTALIVIIFTEFISNLGVRTWFQSY